MLHPLNVVADLALSVDEADVQVTADGDVIVLELPDVRAARKLLQTAPAGRSRAERLAQIHDLLTAAGLTVEVWLHDEILARLGKNARPGGTSRLFRLGNLEVRPGRSLASAARRKPGTVAALLAGFASLLGASLYVAFRRD